MSNTEKMVSVPRDLMQDLYEAAQFEADQRRAALGSFRPHVQDALDKIAADAKAILDQPAEQHQGEPVAYQFQGRDGQWYSFQNQKHFEDTEAEGSWPIRALFTRADPGEVEQLRVALEGYQWGAEVEAKAADEARAEVKALRAQLANAHALLRDALASHGVMLMTDPQQDPWKTRRIGERIREVLSASAEPNQCDGCRAGIPLINGAHRMGKPGGYADTMSCQAGKYANAEPIQPACCAPTEEELALLANGDYRPEELWGGNKPSCHKCHKAEPSAPVERDERAEFERHVILTTGHPVDSELRRHPIRQDEYECRAMQTRWLDWCARAALERKP